jgi:hypothetical protein
MNLLTTSSGLTAKQLTAMTRKQLASYLVEHDHFAAAVAMVKYLSVPESIPSTQEARAAYWSKYYQGTNNPVKQDAYLRDNRLIAQELKATALSNVVKKHLQPQQPTQGLVNRVLHDAKVKHAISSTRKKVGDIFRLFGRR